MTSTQAMVSYTYGAVAGAEAPTMEKTLTAKICGHTGIWKATAAAVFVSTLGSSFALEHATDTNEHTQAPTLSLVSSSDSRFYQRTKLFTFTDQEGVTAYLASHRDVEAFLHASIPIIDGISGGASLSLDYLLEDGWEQIYLIVNLDDESYVHVETIERRLYEEWYLQADENLTRDLVISFS